MGEPKAVAVRETGEIVEHSEWSRSDIELIKEQVAREATDQELRYFLMVCKATGLDPRLKQIYFIKRWDSNAGKKIGAVQSSIDGIRSVAEDSGEYAGQDAPILEFYEHDKNKMRPFSATVTVYRMVSGERVPFTHTAYWDEYVQLTKDGNPTSFWLKMPKNQLAKCAEAGALRKAFPRKLQKIYVHEEMGQADNQLPASPTPKGQPKSKPTTPSDDSGFRMPFGKHKGDLITEVPVPYLQWCLDKMDNLHDETRKIIEAEVERDRKGNDKPAEPEQVTDPARESLLKEIPELEAKLGNLNDAFRPMKAREKSFGGTDITKSKDQELIDYWTSLNSAIETALRKE